MRHLQEVRRSAQGGAGEAPGDAQTQLFEVASRFARERAWCCPQHFAWPEPDIALAAASVALALRPYAREREWLADPFPTLARVAAGAIPIGRERTKLAAATSSLAHAIDGPSASPTDVAIAAALTARTDAEVAVAAGLTLF